MDGGKLKLSEVNTRAVSRGQKIERIGRQVQDGGE
jgi:hypothetical protein